jgi:hypothetical protein
LDGVESAFRVAAKVCSREPLVDDFGQIGHESRAGAIHLSFHVAFEFGFAKNAVALFVDAVAAGVQN